MKIEVKKRSVGKKKHIKRFQIPIYERELRVFVCEDIKSGLDSMNIKEFEGEEEWVEATVIEHDDGYLLVIIQPNATIGTISHEALHVTVSVLDYAGVKLSSKSEEAYAYLIGWVAERIEKAIKSYKIVEPKEPLVNDESDNQPKVD